MRPLDEKETTTVFEKLFKFTGNNLKHIVERPSSEGPEQDPGRYCFRLQKNRVFYVSESLVKRATNINREKLISLGTCIDLPLGFGIAAKSTQDCRKLDPNGIVVLHQADIGEYLRMEDDL
ncbi:60S ribosome subunit biogenesis protein NIP7 homolog isoform X2 [Amborella trichopoda]|uniref:60S ribosome subunit biogenesis protein NIP7 homolog isoform X2 n=1 Tax=Amborella trichopoda TaxID=13333 RepID=UPI0005D3358C|nr:60S ribosome subunit biogenesis protein NIP7 homolog isoform X2 [Amborella trichopoda]|eukprot:XP_011627453.1 60S ribosome subunit biogenesis protein NIP7 homolog isoform X2 [Amborella trichopoda]